MSSITTGDLRTGILVRVLYNAKYVKTFLLFFKSYARQCFILPGPQKGRLLNCNSHHLDAGSVKD